LQGREEKSFLKGGLRKTTGNKSILVEEKRDRKEITRKEGEGEVSTVLKALIEKKRQITTHSKNHTPQKLELFYYAKKKPERRKRRFFPGSFFVNIDTEPLKTSRRGRH